MESRRSESRGLSCSGWAGPSFPPGPVPICDEKLGQVGARERGPAGSGWRGQDQFQDAIFPPPFKTPSLLWGALTQFGNFYSWFGQMLDQQKYCILKLITAKCRLSLPDKPKPKHSGPKSRVKISKVELKLPIINWVAHNKIGRGGKIQISKILFGPMESGRPECQGD